MSARLIAARRSPVAPRGGALSGLEPHEIAAPVIAALLADAGLGPGDVGELICANAIGPGGNPARSVALAAGLPERVGGLTIDRQCAGGLDAIALGAALIAAGRHEVVIAGGVESYSRRPERRRLGADGRWHLYDEAPFTPDPARPSMAEAAAALAAGREISRAAQEAWAMESHAKALAASLPGIVPMAGLVRDPFARRLSPALCARAPVVAGPVTRATMAVAADGAAFVLLAREGGCAILSAQTLGADPGQPGLAPLPAIAAALAEAGLGAADLARAEIMEAFAVQAIACQQGAGIARGVTNPEGGALARGHPIGASGAVLAVDLFHGLMRSGGAGLAAIASAGGLGAAMVLGA